MLSYFTFAGPHQCTALNTHSPVPIFRTSTSSLAADELSVKCAPGLLLLCPSWVSQASSSHNIQTDKGEKLALEIKVGLIFADAGSNQSRELRGDPRDRATPIWAGHGTKRGIVLISIPSHSHCIVSLYYISASFN